MFFILLAIQYATLSSCTLKRDNPYDIHRDSSTNGNNNLHKTSIGFSKYIVSSDNNNDQVVNPGETIGLQVFLKNNSSTKVNKVMAKITCTSQYISSVSPSSNQSYKQDGYYDYISAGYVSEYGGYPNSNTITFMVSNSTPVGTNITFNLVITDQLNNTWNDTFNVVIQKTSADIHFNNYAVSSDNNNNGIVNKGETIGLQVFLKNSGLSKANKVISTISCQNSYVSSLTPSSSQSYKQDGYYDYISAGYVSDYGGYPNSNTISFFVADNTPSGTILKFKMTITDESNNTWIDSFSVAVQPTDANIIFNSFVVSSDGNSDGVVNSGESIGLQVSLKNNGTGKANKVKGVISCTSSYVSLLTPTTTQSYKQDGFYDYISAGYVSEYGGYPNSNTISFKVASSTPIGTSIPFTISIVDESNNIWTDNFNVLVQ